MIPPFFILSMQIQRSNLEKHYGKCTKCLNDQFLDFNVKFQGSRFDDMRYNYNQVREDYIRVTDIVYGCVLGAKGDRCGLQVLSTWLDFRDVRVSSYCYVSQAFQAISCENHHKFADLGKCHREVLVLSICVEEGICYTVSILVYFLTCLLTKHSSHSCVKT